MFREQKLSLLKSAAVLLLVAGMAAACGRKDPPVPAVAQPAPGKSETKAEPPAKLESTGPSPAGPEGGVVWSRDPNVLAQQPPVVAIRPSRPLASGRYETAMSSLRTRTGGQATISLGIFLTNIFIYAHSLGPGMDCRVILPPDAPPDRFDFIDTLPKGGREAMQKLLRDQFGLAGKRETRPVDALLLMLRNPHAGGLRVSTGGSGAKRGLTEMSANGVGLMFLAGQLEAQLGTPVIDQTRLSGVYDYQLTYPPGASLDELKRAVLDQLGLELMPVKGRPVEYFIVEKVN